MPFIDFYSDTLIDRRAPSNADINKTSKQMEQRKFKTDTNHSPLGLHDMTKAQP